MTYPTSSYLALVAALASEADWVFIPEWPPEKGWQDVLCEKLSQVGGLIPNSPSKDGILTCDFDPPDLSSTGENDGTAFEHRCCG